MGNLSRCLIFLLSLASVFFAYSSQAAEDVYLKGEKGHFRLDPGKLYHWEWTEATVAPKKTGLPEKTVVAPPSAMKAAPPATPETPPSAPKNTPQAVQKDTKVSEGETPVITKEAVAMMMSEIENAANRKDIDAISYYLAPELLALMTVDSSGGRQDLRLNKQEYLDRLKREFSIPQYHYKSYNVEVIASQDGKSATVVADIRETVGANIDIVSNQKSAIELRDGQMVVTKIVSTQK